jgi:hypothetical protein
MYSIKARVIAREYVPKTTRSQKWKEEAIIEYETPTKLALLNALRKTFGRCTGKIPLGYTFEGIVRCDDGSKTWWETKVILGGDVSPAKGYNLEKASD